MTDKPQEGVVTEPAEGQEPDAQQQEESPPWGDDFDPEKAWKLVQNLRADKEKLAAKPVLDDSAKQRLDEYDRLVEASKSDLERANEELSRWQGEADNWKRAAVGSKIQALAAADFADPDDAVRALDPAKYLDAGGQIDDKAITADLAALLETKPHYRRSTDPRTPAPNPAQGTSQGGRSADPATEFGAILANQLR